MKIKKGFVVREVGGENIAVPVGETAREFRGMVKLNSTALFLWNFFKSDKTFDEAVSALTEEYDVSRDDAEEGVRSFIKIAGENGFFE